MNFLTDEILKEKIYKAFSVVGWICTVFCRLSDESGWLPDKWYGF